MRYLLLIAGLLVILVLVFGCGSDKPNGPVTPKPQRIVVTQAASAPPLNTTVSTIWDGITPTAIQISTLLSPPPVSSEVTALADSVHVQALTYHDTLYLRISWPDNSHDVWRDAYYVTDTAVPLGGDTATYFDQIDTLMWEEDQLWVLFAGLSSGDWDGLNWRSLTTDSAFLAEGLNVHNDSVLITDAGAVTVARRNYNSINPGFPLYFHKDTSHYTGFTLFENDNLRPADIFIRGWSMAQRVPNYLIDSSKYKLSALERGSRWDTRSIGHWDALRTPTPIYTVVLCRPMNTGFDDDVALVDSVETKIGLFNDQLNFSFKGGDRGFTKEFWLIF